MSSSGGELSRGFQRSFTVFNPLCQISVACSGAGMIKTTKRYDWLSLQPLKTLSQDAGSSGSCQVGFQGCFMVSNPPCQLPGACSGAGMIKKKS